MAKLTLEEKIAKTENALKRENETISVSKEKVKTLSKELKGFYAEKERELSKEILKIMDESGYKSADDKKRFIEFCAQTAKGISDENSETQPKHQSEDLPQTVDLVEVSEENN